MPGDMLQSIYAFELRKGCLEFYSECGKVGALRGCRECIPEVGGGGGVLRG